MTVSTASPLEMLGVVLNVVGIVTAWWMLSLTHARFEAVKRTGGDPTGPRMLVAWRHFRCEGSRIGYHVATLVMGLWAMTLPGGDSAYGFASMVIRVVLAGLFTAMSIADLKSDSRLADLLNDERSATPGAGR
jgi:hypothetical protein